MATKSDLLNKLTKGKLMDLASGAGIGGLTPRMKKDEIVEKIAKSPKVKKADLE